MIYKSFLIVFIGLFVGSFSTSDRTMKKANKEISKFYEVENFSKEALIISKEDNKATPSDFKHDNFFKVIKNDKFLGYAYIGNAPSKTATFDYLVLFDKDFIVTKSKVLIYREEYGGEIGSKRWLKQFIGKKEGDNVLHGQDIIAIAGATISTTSMTRAMNSLFESLKILNSKDAL